MKGEHTNLRQKFPLLFIALNIWNRNFLVHGLSSRHHHRFHPRPASATGVSSLSSLLKHNHEIRSPNCENIKLFNSNKSNENTNDNENNTEYYNLLSSFSQKKTESTTNTAKSTTINDNSKRTLLTIFLSSFATITILAKLNLIGPYTTNDLIVHDASVAILSTVLALLFVKSITTLAKRNILQSRDSRKIIHSLSAPLFMILWPFFNTDIWGARLFAASVPFLQGCRLWLAAMNRGGRDGDELAGAISRSGDEKEALGGPFIYVVILFIAILTCFTDNYSAMMALSAMAAGDGFADIIGRRYGKNNKWFFNSDKSIVGTLAFIVASSLCSIGLGFYFQAVGAVVTTVPFIDLMGRFVTISVLSAFIELIPIADDNWTVPISAGALSFLILQ